MAVQMNSPGYNVLMYYIWHLYSPVLNLVQFFNFRVCKSLLCKNEKNLDWNFIFLQEHNNSKATGMPLIIVDSVLLLFRQTNPFTSLFTYFLLQVKMRKCYSVGKSLSHVYVQVVL